MRRGQHPYFSSTYINGYVKDIPLRNKTHEETINHLLQTNSDWGHKAIKHSQNKILGGSRSIQGEWKNDDEWENYPKHMLEKKHEIPFAIVDPLPMKEIIKGKKSPDYYTTFLRKKFAINQSYRK